MTYQVPDNAVDAEKTRHRYLAEVSDAETASIFDAIGVARGWRCLEVGMGGGSVAALLADLVGDEGEVLATDIDLRLSDTFIPDPAPSCLRVQEHDICADELPEAHFDVVHSRALLEHLPEPEKGLANMIKATRPGGWVVAEGSSWALFDIQEIPGRFGELMKFIAERRNQGGDDHRADFSAVSVAAMRRAGLVDIDCRGHLWPMRGAQPSLEWLILALEWGLKGVVDDDLLSEAIAEARAEDFLVFSPTHVSAWGRRPS